jgi:hypothetical protein
MRGVINMVDIDAFLLGMKPAYYGNTGSPTMVNNMDKLEHYPCITDGIDIFDGQDFFLFFQDEQLKNDFLNKVNQVPPRSPAFHELLGKALGYPPLAARFYAQCTDNESLYDFSLSIRYAGVRCISHVDELIENATWLWDRYTENEDMKILINTSYYPVIRYDTERLNEIKRIHKKQKTA